MNLFFLLQALSSINQAKAELSDVILHFFSESLRPRVRPDADCHLHRALDGNMPTPNVPTDLCKSQTGYRHSVDHIPSICCPWRHIPRPDSGLPAPVRVSAVLRAKLAGGGGDNPPVDNLRRLLHRPSLHHDLHLRQGRALPVAVRLGGWKRR